MKSVVAHLDAWARSCNAGEGNWGERFRILAPRNVDRTFTGTPLLAGGWAESSFLPKTGSGHPDGPGRLTKLWPCTKGA